VEVKGACKSRTTINPVSIWAVRFAVKLAIEIASCAVLCPRICVCTYTRVVRHVCVCDWTLRVHLNPWLWREGLTFSLLNDTSEASHLRSYSSAFYSRVESCMHSHLAPFIGLPHRAGHGVACLLNARFVRAAALVIGHL